MSFRTLWTSIPRFQHASYRPALVEPLPLRLQLTFLPQRFLSQHNPQSISLSLHWLRSAFLVAFPPHASFWISSCAMLQGLGLSLPPTRSCHYSLDDVVGLTALSIYRICVPGVAKSSFLEHWPFWLAWTLLLGEMLNVASYGRYGGKLRLSCQGWYVYSCWTKQNLPLDCQEIRNRDANRTIWHDC